jgi:protein transport protein SEC24
VCDTAITQSASKSLRQVRDQLTELCVKALLAYRKHCASSTSPAQVNLPSTSSLIPTDTPCLQLILPESFKLFPLYALALMKSKALKGPSRPLLFVSLTDASRAGGPVASDVRTWHMRLIKSAGVAATVGLLYPRMLPIHNFSDEMGFPDENGKLVLPSLMRTSYARMEPNGAYLVGASPSPPHREMN